MSCYDVTLRILCFLMSWIHFEVLVYGKGERRKILGVISKVGNDSGTGVSLMDLAGSGHGWSLM